MNKIKIVLSAFLFSFIASCHSQKVLAVENVVDYMGGKLGGIEENGYTSIKDVNGVLNKFVGVWAEQIINSPNNKAIKIKIDKIFDSSKSIPKDLLILRYQITNSSGTVIESTLNLANSNINIVRGLYLAKSGNYVLYFDGGKNNCGLDGDLFIKIGSNSRSLKVVLHPIGDAVQMRCPDNKSYVHVFPTNEITLSKL